MIQVTMTMTKSQGNSQMSKNWPKPLKNGPYYQAYFKMVFGLKICQKPVKTKVCEVPLT